MKGAADNREAKPFKKKVKELSMRTFPEVKKASPWHSARPNHAWGKPKAIIVHHSAGSWAGTIDWVTRKANKANVSYHVYVNTDGRRVQFVDPSRKAWHAGKSVFLGRRYVNNFSLGISVTNVTQKREHTKEEIESVAEKCVEWMKRYKIPIEAVASHREIAPGRKNDTGVVFFEKVIKEIKKRL